MGCTTNNTTIVVRSRDGFFGDSFKVVIDDQLYTTEIPLTRSQACAMLNVVIDIRIREKTPACRCAEVGDNRCNCDHLGDGIV